MNELQIGQTLRMLNQTMINTGDIVFWLRLNTLTVLLVVSFLLVFIGAHITIQIKERKLNERKNSVLKDQT